MSVIIDEHISIGIACHEIKATCVLNLIFLSFFFFFGGGGGSLSVVFNHGKPLSFTMVDHGPGPWLAMVLIRPWSFMGGNLTKHGLDYHGRPWYSMLI